MKVRIWGCRGSIPVALNGKTVRAKILDALERAQGSQDLSTPAAREHFVDEILPMSTRQTFGGNTSCVEIENGDAPVICDAGSGIRELGNSIRQRDPKPREFHIFLSHLHYDHLQGFPFFGPAYEPGNSVHFYGCHPGIEEALNRHQAEPFFPVPLEYMRAAFTFHKLEPGAENEIAGFRVRAIEQDHPGVSYGYRFEKNGKTFVYSTDSEHRMEMQKPDYPFVEFFSKADLLIFDAQYLFSDSILSKENWGHSSNVAAIELALRAQVAHVCLFHHDPASGDLQLESLGENTERLLQLAQGGAKLKISVAYDGLEFDL
jgi:phosphoribosyl 1,2-cyclic phosphodiesterase